MNAEFDALYARSGRDSVPPERLLRASLLQVLFSIRSERQLVEHIDFNLLYRWFVGLTMDDEVWDHSTFSANRDRLLNERMSRLFFERVLLLAEWKEPVSDEHFSVDGTLIKAWASMKSFVNKDGGTPPPEDQSRNPSVNFKGEKRSNDTHASTVVPDVSRYKKSEGDKSQLCFMGHVLMANCNGLVVDADVTHATGTAERDAAKAMAKHSIRRHARGGFMPQRVQGGYDTKDFVAAIPSGAQVRERQVTPHVAQKAKDSAIDRRTARHAGYRTSLKIRKRVEEVFG